MILGVGRARVLAEVTEQTVRGAGWTAAEDPLLATVTSEKARGEAMTLEGAILQAQGSVDSRMVEVQS